MAKKNPAEFPAEYQGKNLSTMDVSFDRIGETALTLEEHQAGQSIIAPEPKHVPHTQDVDTARHNITLVDFNDPRVKHEDLNGHIKI